MQSETVSFDDKRDENSAKKPTVYPQEVFIVASTFVKHSLQVRRWLLVCITGIFFGVFMFHLWDAIACPDSSAIYDFYDAVDGKVGDGVENILLFDLENAWQWIDDFGQSLYIHKDENGGFIVNDETVPSLMGPINNVIFLQFAQIGRVNCNTRQKTELNFRAPKINEPFDNIYRVYRDCKKHYLMVEGDELRYAANGDDASVLLNDSSASIYQESCSTLSILSTASQQNMTSALQALEDNDFLDNACFVFVEIDGFVNHDGGTFVRAIQLWATEESGKILNTQAIVCFEADNGYLAFDTLVAVILLFLALYDSRKLFHDVKDFSQENERTWKIIRSTCMQTVKGVCGERAASWMFAPRKKRVSLEKTTVEVELGEQKRRPAPMVKSKSTIMLAAVKAAGSIPKSLPVYEDEHEYASTLNLNTEEDAVTPPMTPIPDDDNGFTFEHAIDVNQAVDKNYTRESLMKALAKSQYQDSTMSTVEESSPRFANVNTTTRSFRGSKTTDDIGSVSMRPQESWSDGRKQSSMDNPLFSGSFQSNDFDDISMTSSPNTEFSQTSTPSSPMRKIPEEDIDLEDPEIGTALPVLGRSSSAFSDAVHTVISAIRKRTGDGVATPTSSPAQTDKKLVRIEERSKAKVSDDEKEEEHTHRHSRPDRKHRSRSRQNTMVKAVNVNVSWFFSQLNDMSLFKSNDTKYRSMTSTETWRTMVRTAYFIFLWVIMFLNVVVALAFRTSLLRKPSISLPNEPSKEAFVINSNPNWWQYAALMDRLDFLVVLRPLNAMTFFFLVGTVLFSTPRRSSISFIPNLIRKTIRYLIAPGISLLVVFFIYAFIGRMLFSRYNYPAFGTMDRSFDSILQMSLGEGPNANDLLTAYGLVSEQLVSANWPRSLSSFVPRFFYWSFHFFVGFTMLNVFIAVIVSVYTETLQTRNQKFVDQSISDMVGHKFYKWRDSFFHTFARGSYFIYCIMLRKYKFTHRKIVWRFFIFISKQYAYVLLRKLLTDAVVIAKGRMMMEAADKLSLIDKLRAECDKPVEIEELMGIVVDKIFTDWCVAPFLKKEVKPTEETAFTEDELFETDDNDSKAIIARVGITADLERDLKIEIRKKLKNLNADIISFYTWKQALNSDAIEDSMNRHTITKLLNFL